MGSRQYATFEVEDQLFGVPVAIVQEVLSFSEYTPVPLAPLGSCFPPRPPVPPALMCACEAMEPDVCSSPAAMP